MRLQAIISNIWAFIDCQVFLQGTVKLFMALLDRSIDISQENIVATSL